MHSLYGVRSIVVGHSSLDLSIHDLELMHHYQQWVSPTLSGKPPVQQIWQSAIPKEATSHSGLMHGLLALAALHRSRLDNRAVGRYRAPAMRHQNLSLPYLRSLIVNASAENCNALFALSTIVLVFMFALPQSSISPEEFDTFKEMMTIIELVRGVRAVTEMTGTWLLQGPLRPVLLPEVWEVRSIVPEDIGNALDCLVLKNNSLVQSIAKRATYDTAIRMLRKTFEMITLNPDDPGVGLHWAAVMERQYIDLLKAKEPMALVLLAHFGVAINASREDWWSGKCGCQLVKAVHDMLNEQWRSLIRWLLISVGLFTHALPAASCLHQHFSTSNTSTVSSTLRH
jgi:hypothetical protein